MREALTRREADMELTQLAAALPTDAMPGEADPATYALPQQPMHRRASRLMLQQRNLAGAMLCTVSKRPLCPQTLTWPMETLFEPHAWQ